MDNSQDRTGDRLGPYHLDRLYEDIGEPGGQLYAAHHVDTGRPALLFIPEPGATWAPRGDWSAQVTSQTSPPFLATELTRPPPASASLLTDVDLTFIRLAGAYTCLEEHLEANTVLTQPPGPTSSPSRANRLSRKPSLRTGVLVAGALALAAVVLWPRIMGSPEREAGDSSAGRVVVLMIDNQNSHATVGYPMPDAAFPEQMTPPCQGTQVELRGGCWMTLEQRTPCDKDTAEYEGKCYVPVQKKKPAPRSVKP